jgi:hypothetical protein
MGKTTRFTRSKPKRYKRYRHGGLNVKDKEGSVKVDVISATMISQNRPKEVKKVAATGDKYNTYKTRIT